MLAAARAAGATTSLDTNWDPSGRWGDERLSAALAQADLLLPNEAEALPAERRGRPGRGGARRSPRPGPAWWSSCGERGALCADGTRQHGSACRRWSPVDSHRRGGLL